MDNASGFSQSLLNQRRNKSICSGQQILRLIGDKSDGSARLSNCDALVSRGNKKAASPTTQEGGEGKVEPSPPLKLKQGEGRCLPLKQSGGGGANSGAIRPNCDAATTRPNPSHLTVSRRPLTPVVTFFKRFFIWMKAEVSPVSTFR